MAHARHWTEKYAFPLVIIGVLVMSFIYWKQTHDFKAHVQPKAVNK